MGEVIILGGAGGGAGSSDATATRDQVLAGYTAITNDSNDNPIEGTITTHADSGNVTLDSDTTIKSYAAGYYPNAHGAVLGISDYDGSVS